MKRALALVCSLAILLSLVLAGCSQPGGTSTPADNTTQQESTVSQKEDTADQKEDSADQQEETVTITYLSRWANPSDPRSVYYMGKLEEFRDLYPNIIVDDISIGDDSEAHKAKVNSGIAAGNPPDMFITNTNLNTKGWTETGAISDIMDLINSSEWTGPTGDLVSGFTYDGLVYGCPNMLITTLTLTNTKIFRDLGLEVPDTWEDLEACIPALEEAGIVPFGVGAQALNECDRFVLMTGMMMYGLEFRDKIVSGEWRWDGPECQSVLEKVKYFMDNGFLDPNAVSLSGQSGTIPMFEQGQIAVMITPSWNISMFQDMDFAEDIRVNNFLYFEDKPENKGIWLASLAEGFVISPDKGTPEYDACCKLLSFLMSADTFSGFVETMGGGVVPTEVDFDLEKADPVMRSYMENYAANTDITDVLMVYLDSEIPLVTPTQQELQGLFAGRSPAEVGESLQAIYDKEIN